MSGGYGNQLNSQLAGAASAHGLSSPFGSGTNFGQANLTNTLGQGALGANQYIQGVQNQANTTGQNFVAQNTGNFAMNPSDLTQFTVSQNAQDVANNNASAQNLLQNEMGMYQNFGNSVNSMAGQLQSVANENAAAQNQTSAANLGFVGGLASAAVGGASTGLQAANQSPPYSSNNSSNYGNYGYGPTAQMEGNYYGF